LARYRYDCFSPLRFGFLRSARWRGFSATLVLCTVESENQSRASERGRWRTRSTRMRFTHIARGCLQHPLRRRPIPRASKGLSAKVTHERPRYGSARIGILNWAYVVRPSWRPSVCERAPLGIRTRNLRIKRPKQGSPLCPDWSTELAFCLWPVHRIRCIAPPYY